MVMSKSPSCCFTLKPCLPATGLGSTNTGAPVVGLEEVNGFARLFRKLKYLKRRYVASKRYHFPFSMLTRRLLYGSAPQPVEFTSSVSKRPRPLPSFDFARKLESNTRGPALQFRSLRNLFSLPPTRRPR